MNTLKILKAALKNCDRQLVAKNLGISLGSLNNQIAGELPYTPKGQTQNFLERTVNFIDTTFYETHKMIVLEALAAEFGFILVADPILKSHDSQAIQKISLILKDFSQLIDEISLANADGLIEAHEAERIRNKWTSLKMVIEEFVLCCETGKYK